MPSSKRSTSATARAAEQARGEPTATPGDDHANREIHGSPRRRVVQAAQSAGAAQRPSAVHAAEHLLKVLLDDQDGLAANLIAASGGDPSRCGRRWTAELAKLPKVEGGGAGQVYLAPETARLFDQAEQMAQKAGDTFVTVETAAARPGAGERHAGGRHPRQAGVTPAEPQQGDRRSAQGPHGRHRLRRGGLRRAEEVHARPHRGGAQGQARSGDRPRRGDPPHHPGAVAPHQEQSRADRRAGRRQDRHRRGPGPAHRQRRRAREPEGQAAAVARSRRAGRRRQISRRVRGAAEGGARRR